MKTLLLLALTMAFGPPQTHGDLQDFWEMIKITTGKNAVSDYAFYGCYCGLGGHGTPMDETDRCCAEHDCCYSRLEKQKCGTKFLKYNFVLLSGHILCVDFDYCPRQVCQCDKIAAYCFARNRNTYDRRYKFYWDIFCTGTSPPCLEFPIV